jgi:hypothetical protein
MLMKAPQRYKWGGVRPSEIQKWIHILLGTPSIEERQILVDWCSGKSQAEDYIERICNVYETIKAYPEVRRSFRGLPHFTRRLDALAVCSFLSGDQLEEMPMKRILKIKRAVRAVCFLASEGVWMNNLDFKFENLKKTKHLISEGVRMSATYMENTRDGSPPPGLIVENCTVEMALNLIFITTMTAVIVDHLLVNVECAEEVPYKQDTQNDESDEKEVRERMNNTEEKKGGEEKEEEDGTQDQEGGQTNKEEGREMMFASIYTIDRKRSNNRKGGGNKKQGPGGRFYSAEDIERSRNKRGKGSRGDILNKIPLVYPKEMEMKIIEIPEEKGKVKVATQKAYECMSRLLTEIAEYNILE